MTRRSGGALRAALAGLAAFLVLVLAGCSSDRSASSVPTGEATTTTRATVVSGRAPEGFAPVTLVVTAPDGSVREWCVWLADTAALRAQGLMDVTDPGLGGASAMVFAFPADTTAGFWMKDTLLPLSIAWFAVDGSFVSAADMDPCPAGVEPCPSTSPGARYRYAIEVAQGGLQSLGLVAGSSVALGSSCVLEALAA